MRHKIIRLHDFIEEEKAFQEYINDNESFGNNNEELFRVAKIIMLIMQNELTDKQKECFYKYVIEGKKMKEIAKEIGKCIPTVSRHIKSAKQNVLKYIKYSRAVDKYVSAKTNDD